MAIVRENQLTRNSSLALERLRILVDRISLDGDRKLPTERDLSERIGVGRRAIRRALEVLEAEGLIWRRQGVGTFIGTGPEQEGAPQLGTLPETSNMLEVMEVRLLVEPMLARLAAIRATPHDIARMHHLTGRIDEAADMDSRELWDGALHRAIAGAAGNSLFLALFDIVDRMRQNENWRHMREALRTAETVTLYQTQHADIVTAMEDHDPVAAEQAMRRHLLALQERLMFRSPQGTGQAATRRTPRQDAAPGHHITEGSGQHD